MAFTRTRVVFSLVAVAVLASLAYGAYLEFGPSSKYRGLTTHVDVQIDEATKTYVQNQLNTSKASLAATQAKGGEIDLDVYADIANNAVILGDLVTAREALEAELKGNPINYVATNSYGDVLEKMGDYTGARRAYEKALELSAGTGPESFYINEIDLLYAHFPLEIDAIKAVLDQSVAKKGQTSWNMVQLGRWYEAVGDCQNAIEHYSVAKALAPANVSIAQDLQTLQATCNEN